MAHGGRWMAKGITQVAYASVTENIALKEASHNFTRYGIKPRQKPRLIVELEIRISRMVVLRDLLKAMPWPDLNELLVEEWEPINERGKETLSQALGRALFELGVEGCLIPSVRDRRGNNLILFPKNLRKDSRIEIVGENELERWIAK